MKKINLCVVVKSVALLVSFLAVSCHKDDMVNTLHQQEHSLQVINHWSSLWGSTIKPADMSLFVYDSSTTEYVHATIHPDGGKISVPYHKVNWFSCNIDHTDGRIKFNHLDHYQTAEATLVNRQVNGQTVQEEPYVLFVESVGSFPMEEDQTVHCSPISLTRLLQLNVQVKGDSVEHISYLEGTLSGLSAAVTLSSKTPSYKTGRQYLSFSGIGNSYYKQMLHFGFMGQNLLTLTFTYEDGRKKTIQTDLTNWLDEWIQTDVRCNILINFGVKDYELEIDCFIDPWETETGGNITLL